MSTTGHLGVLCQLKSTESACHPLYSRRVIPTQPRPFWTCILDDAEWFAELAKSAGVEVELERVEGQQYAHVDSSWMPSSGCYLLSTLSFKLAFCFVGRWGYCLNTVIVPTGLGSVDAWK